MSASVRLVELFARVDAARVLSLDIFDTLLCRTTAHPHDVFLEVGRRALERGWLPSHLSPEHVRALRINAERRARSLKNPDGPAEVTLVEIWEAMPFVSSERGRLIDLEVEVERDSCFRNPVTWSLVERARSRGIPVALVSDMYLSRSDLRRILAACGCPLDGFAALLVSSEGRGAKWNGRLFEELCARFPDVAREAIVHIGDNLRSDVEQARQAGLTACHYDWSSEQLDEVERLDRLRHPEHPSPVRALRRLTVAAFDEPETDQWWATLGASVLGPFLAAFSDWVVDQCVAANVRVVRPVMREGALLARLIAASASARGVSLDVQPLYASRAAVWLAGLDDFDDRAIDDLCSRPHLTVSEACTMLGFDSVPHELASYADVVVSSATMTASVADAEGALRSYLRRKTVAAAVERNADSHRQRVARYLEQSIGTAPSVAVVDLGFHGTIGAALERMSRARLAARWHQFLAIGAESIERAWFDGSDVRAFVGGPATHTELVPALVRHAAVLEAMIVTGATTIGYDDEGGQIVPRLAPRMIPAEQERWIGACHRGIVAFQRASLDARAARGSLHVGSRPDAARLCALVHRLIELPSADEARRIGMLVHEHNGGGQMMEVLIDTGRLPRELDAESFLEEINTQGRSSGHTWLWPNGVIAQRWPGYLVSRWQRLRGEAGPAPALERLARTAHRRGVRRCLVYGAGDAGRSLASALRANGIVVCAFVDRNEKLWGASIEGIPVIGPPAALNGDCHTYVVGSIAFAEQIHADLQILYARRAADLRVIAVSGTQERPHAA